MLFNEVCRHYFVLCFALKYNRKITEKSSAPFSTWGLILSPLVHFGQPKVLLDEVATVLESRKPAHPKQHQYRVPS